MIQVADLLRNPDSRYFLSFLIGMGIAILLFHRPQKTVHVPAMPPTEMTQHVVRMDGKCYRFRMEDASCQ
jgi:hypothetical protein